MNNYIKELASQNPYMDLKCNNCNRTSKIKTLDFFKSNKSYSYKCPYCSETTIYNNVSEAAEDIKKSFEKLNIYLK